MGGNVINNKVGSKKPVYKSSSVRYKSRSWMYIYTEQACKQKKSFVTTESGIKSSVLFSDGVYFEKNDMSMFYLGSHISKLIYDNVSNRIEKGLYVPFNPPCDNFRHINTVVFHPDTIADNCFGVECFAIDISRCYFKTAHMIGAIDDLTYDKVCVKHSDKKFKRAMAASVGSLGSCQIKRTYKDGVLVGIESNRRPYNNVRLDIIDTVWDRCFDIIRDMPDGFCMFLTDCFYVTADYVDFVEKRLSLLGYEFKKERVWFHRIKSVGVGMNKVYTVEYLKESNIGRGANPNIPNKKQDESVVSFGLQNTYDYISHCGSKYKFDTQH